MRYKAIIFDLDGTLIDSLLDIAICANIALENKSFKTHEIDEYRYFVGDGAEILIRNAMPKDANEEDIISVLNHFKKIYDLNIHSNTKAYEGIYDLLERLEKLPIKKGILSNKPHNFTLKYAQNLFGNYTFLEVHGQKDNIPKKPDPTIALQIADSFKIKPKEILYVGDTATDMLTASNAGFDSVGVLWGFRDEEELSNNGADYLVSHPLDILKIL